MGIADIIAEQHGVSTQQQTNQRTTNQTRTSLTLDLGGMDRDELLFWMQVVQTIALVYIALKLS